MLTILIEKYQSHKLSQSKRDKEMSKQDNKFGPDSKSLPEHKSWSFLDGPRQKNLATEQLEYIVYAWLADKTKFTFSKSGDLLATVDSFTFNVTEILEWADFEQLAFSDQLLDRYEEICKDDNLYLKVFSNMEFSLTHPHLHLAEKIAINHWTKNSYYKMQDLLRKDYKDLKNPGYLLATICIACHGLSRPIAEPGKEYMAIRGENYKSADKLFLERREKSQQKQLMVNRGFTAVSRNSNNGSYDIKILIPSNKSRRIDALSEFEEEAEDLFPPNIEFAYDFLGYDADSRENWRALPVRSIDREKEYKYTHPLNDHELFLKKTMIKVNFLSHFLIQKRKENTHGKIRLFFDTIDNAKKLKCISEVIEKLEVLKESEAKGMPFVKIFERLTEVILTIHAEISNNEQLVRKAKHRAALGETHNCLIKALAIVNGIEADFRSCDPIVENLSKPVIAEAKIS